MLDTTKKYRLVPESASANERKYAGQIVQIVPDFVESPQQRILNAMHEELYGEPILPVRASDGTIFASRGKNLVPVED